MSFNWIGQTRWGGIATMGRSVCALLAVVLLGLGCSGPDSALKPAPVQVRELSLSNYAPANYHLTRVLNQYAREVETATGGRVKITVYSDESLTKSAQTYDGVAKGVSDMGFTHLSYNPGRFPLMEVVDLPLPGVKDSTQASLAAWKVYQRFQPKELDDIKVLGFVSLAGGTLFTNKPVSRLEDVAGQQIRGTGNDVPVIQALGGTAVALPITEARVALQKGIVDGILTDDAAMSGYRFGDALRYKVVYPGGLRQATAWYGMNRGVWDSLSPDIQDVISEISTRYIRTMGDSRNEANERGAQYVRDSGVQITTLPQAELEKWQKSLQVLRDRYVRDKSAMGLPAQEALDFLIATLQSGD